VIVHLFSIYYYNSTLLGNKDPKNEEGECGGVSHSIGAIWSQEEFGKGLRFQSFWKVQVKMQPKEQKMLQK
jgi:hypothetical protein